MWRTNQVLKSQDTKRDASSFMQDISKKLINKITNKKSLHFDVKKINIVRELQKPENAQLLEDM